MSQVLPGLYYSREHEWVQIKGDKAIVGITDHAQAALGDVVYFDFSAAGRTVKQHESVATIESVKAVSDIYIPLSGTILRANPAISADPAVVNRDPYGDGWLLEMQVSAPDEIANLMDAAAYSAYLATL